MTTSRRPRTATACGCAAPRPDERAKGDDDGQRRREAQGAREGRRAGARDGAPARLLRQAGERPRKGPGAPQGRAGGQEPAPEGGPMSARATTDPWAELAELEAAASEAARGVDEV